MIKTYKKSLIAAFLFLFLGSIGWAVLFHYGMVWLKKEIALVERDLKQQGYEITYSSLTFQGNPFALTAIFRDPYFKDSMGVLEWAGPEMTAKIRPWNWHTISFTLPHNPKLLIKTELLREVRLEGATGALHLTSQGKINDLSLSIQRLSFWKDAQPRPVFLSAISLTVKNLTTPLTLQMSAKGLVKGVETFLKEPSSSEPLTFSLEAHLSGFQEKKAFPLSVAEWRDGGGVLEVDLLKLEWLPLSMIADGTLTFDKEMYLLGSFKTQIIGYKQALNHLAEVGIVKLKNATMATFVLDMLSHPAGKGEKYIDVPVTLQDKKISIGAIPLYRMD